MKIVLGITGEIASGKGTAASYFEKKYGASTYRFSTILRDVANRLYLEHSRHNLQTLSTILRQNFGEDLLAKVMLHDVKNDPAEIVVVEGIRREADIAFLKSLPEFKLLYIEADIKTRYQRLILRRENKDDARKTFLEFKKDHERETEIYITSLKKLASHVIDNNGSMEKLYEQLNEIVRLSND
jgi:dephospho-CoA kinase